jgi:hypothetical protein
MASDIPQLRTAGVIAAELNAPLSRVLYVLRYRNIQPIGRAGVLRLYDRSAVDSVRAALAEIDRQASALRLRDTEASAEEAVLRTLEQRPAEVAQAEDDS